MRPTTGLHFKDIEKLLTSMNALVDHGHTVIVIEHNMEVIKSADWILDLGPEGGDGGGTLCFAGTPEDMIKFKRQSHSTVSKRKAFLKFFLSSSKVIFKGRCSLRLKSQT